MIEATKAEKQEICRMIGHQFPPKQAWELEEPDSKVCTFCTTRVERIGRRVTTKLRSAVTY